MEGYETTIDGFTVTNKHTPDIIYTITYVLNGGVFGGSMRISIVCPGAFLYMIRYVEVLCLSVDLGPSAGLWHTETPCLKAESGA